jgi:inorganic pyrophosphatase
VAGLTGLPNQLDAETGVCQAIIETPKGSRNKFTYEPESNLFKLGFVLPEGMVFPFDFGFIPSTPGGDGDAIDVLVLMDAPAHVGCLVEIRLIGVISAEQVKDGQKEINDRLLGTAIPSYDHEGVTTMDQIGKTMLSQLEEFFVSYNKQRGKKFRITGRGGPAKAIRLVKAGIKLYNARQD